MREKNDIGEAVGYINDNSNEYGIGLNETEFEEFLGIYSSPECSICVYSLARDKLIGNIATS